MLNVLRVSSLLRTSLVTIALIGCKGSENNVELLDEDLDGWSAPDDCDDYDGTVNPDAEDVCDGVDNDCDGVVDGGLGTFWYADTDGDGFGDAGASTESCEAPEGYVANSEDCDDTDALVSPDGVEECNGYDDDCDTQIDEEGDTQTWFADNDDDGHGDPDSAIEACTPPSGYVMVGDDCDDADAYVYPGADEFCNDVDDDCDAVVDNDPVDGIVWYADADGDNYGDAAVFMVSCDQPSGYVADDSDCDDVKPGINPGATEKCNLVDDDCDGTVDDGIPTTTWYADTDGDGYGDPSATVDSCSKPSGYVATADDCDDTDATINPAASEYCDGEDDDCDGSVDEDAVDDGTWYADADGDGFGDPSTSQDSCSAPSGYVADNTDCGDSDVTMYPGADEYCDGADDDCDGTVDDNAVDGDFYATDADGDGFGAAGSTDWACDGVDNEWDCDDVDATEPVVVDAATGSSSGSGTLSSPLASIQSGINAASSCVVVYGGTYTEAISFGGANISVTGVEGAAATTIDASATGGAAVSFVNSETAAATLTGFTITGGTGRVESSSSSYACSSVTTCTDYTSIYCGGGIAVDGADPTLVDLIIDGNTLPEASTTESGDDTYYVYSYGGGACFNASNSTLSGVSIYGNTADQGGALYVDSTSSIEFSRGEVMGNSSADGGGFQVDGGALTLTNVVSAFNDATASGGGVLVIDGTLTATNVTHGGDAATTGGGVYLSGSSSATVINSIIYGSPTGIGVLVDSGSSWSGSYNNVYGNTAGNYSGLTDPTGSSGNISSDPLFTAYSDNANYTDDDFTLGSGSPSIDAGNAGSSYNDADGTRNDQGAYGGPNSDW